jgi:hypothetical protein
MYLLNYYYNKTSCIAYIVSKKSFDSVNLENQQTMKVFLNFHDNKDFQLRVIDDVFIGYSVSGKDYIRQDLSTQLLGYKDLIDAGVSILEIDNQRSLGESIFLTISDNKYQFVESVDELKKLDLPINQVIKEIHENNVKAGWWSNLKTGESILETRNRSEILALVHSEVSEAYFGFKNDLMDDKITSRKMLFVELADTAIRLMDLMGAEKVFLTLEDLSREDEGIELMSADSAAALPVHRHCLFTGAQAVQQLPGCNDASVRHLNK